MSERETILEQWAAKRAMGKGFRETAHIYERLSAVCSNVSEIVVSRDRVALTFLGGHAGRSRVRCCLRHPMGLRPACSGALQRC